MRNTWAAEQRDLSAGFCKEGLDFRFVRIRKVTMATVTAVEEIKRLILQRGGCTFSYHSLLIHLDVPEELKEN